MKYKTAFRLALKLFGVVLFTLGATSMINAVIGVITIYTQRAAYSGNVLYWSWAWSGGGFSGATQLAVGVYFFFGGEWVVNKAIPSNRPYCHECRYDLTGAAGHVCNECGTPFKPSET